MVINTPLTKTGFQGAIQSGLNQGNNQLNTVANVRLSRTCTVSAASSANIVLPGDATQIATSLIITAGSAGALSKVRFGNVADATHFSAFTQVSAAGLYNMPTTVSAQSMLTQVGSDNIMVIRGSSLTTAFLGVAQVTFQRRNG